MIWEIFVVICIIAKSWSGSTVDCTYLILMTALEGVYSVAGDLCNTACFVSIALETL